MFRYCSLRQFKGLFREIEKKFDSRVGLKRWTVDHRLIWCAPAISERPHCVGLWRCCWKVTRKAYQCDTEVVSIPLKGLDTHAAVTLQRCTSRKHDYWWSKFQESASCCWCTSCVYRWYARHRRPFMPKTIDAQFVAKNFRQPHAWRHNQTSV